MSIKKLFETKETNRNYLASTDQKSAFETAESSKNIQQISQKQNAFVPQIDYSDPENFAKYGSARLYYKAAMEHIYDYYPYDGSDADINKFYNNLLNVEKYIFDNEYPRTNGYAIISADGWGTLNGSQDDGYGLPNSLEYITFYGGPNASSYSNLTDAFNNPENSKFQSSNVYDTDIYTTAGEPSDYGSGTRQSNLRSNFTNGVTIEFWLKKDAFNTSLTEKEVVYDMWNNNASGSAGYGRMRVELTGAASGSPFLITALSGTSGIYQQSIGTNLTTGSLENFAHYAVSFYNDGSNFITKLYVNGILNDTNTTSGTLNELNSTGMMGRIGALLTASASPSGPVGAAGSGKLSGSIDEFRFWKDRRDSKQIFDNYNRQVRGGTNTDISNTTLGVYFKFNEGITADSTIDSNVLDYSGRISNGSWTGYGSSSRSTNSAIVLAGAASAEYLDPIIYSTHPDVATLNSELEEKGSTHDLQNNNSFVKLLPSWLNEQDDDQNTNIRKLSQIVGAYFDKIYHQINSLPTFKGPNYTSSSYSPIPFARHLPQSLGLYTPELFIESDVVERFLNRTPDANMESDLTETKNLIYLNLYNNIADIFKAKGTEKSVRNVLRCFNLDDKIIKLKTYANNQIFEIRNNLKLTLEDNTSVNNNDANNLGGVVYQKADPSNTDALGFISGTYDSSKEVNYGFTSEANIIFPNYERIYAEYDRSFTEVSLFGMNEANTSSADDTTWLGTDNANFQVFAVRDASWSKNVYFKLTSSVSPNPFPELTSSTFFDVYDNQEWNFSVRLKPSNYPLTNLVSGAGSYTYTLEFQGLNAVGDTIQDSFLLTASVDQATGEEFLKSAKRVYAGAYRTNVTGALLQKSDILVKNIKYWTKYLDNNSIYQHLYNSNNAGISGSYKNLSALDTNLVQTDAKNLNTLALHWTFDNITGSDSSGNFYYVTDLSSGSAEIRNNFGWIGGVSGYQYTGYGFGYTPSSTNVVKKDKHNVLKIVDPESAVSSNMINILSDSDKMFNLSQDKPEYYHVLEKSMYGAISEDMMDFFAGIVDFNNIIGEPVHRYRQEYKTLNKLREIYFRRVSNISSVNKFIDYYKWLDDSISIITSQLLPASDGVIEDSYNVIESHVLERNKYRAQFPTIEFKNKEPLPTPILGINEKVLNWRLNHAPISALEREHSPWWLERTERSNVTITSGDTEVDSQRETIRQTANIDNNQSQPTLVTIGGTTYQGSVDVLRRHAKPYRLEIINKQEIGGGVNFEHNKNIHFTYNSLAPAGPVWTGVSGTIFVPQNVLVAFTEDMADLKDSVDVTNPSKKIKRNFQVAQGRDWFDGGEYTNTKSTFSFPFNIISGAVGGSGYNQRVVEDTELNIDIVNLHNDTYLPSMEVPMQGPFTNYAVGGHQSRHIKLNDGSDRWYNRPEAWKLLLGTDSIPFGFTAAIGMAGADYPWPEANEVGETPYPMTASQKAVFFRDEVAKRPVNIRNIQHRTGSTILGNYNRNYEVVHTFGGFSNPRGFVENPPTLPTEVTQTPSATQGRTILSNRRNAESHFEFTPSYDISYMTSSGGKSVVRTRFSAPGGIETLGQGYGDIRSNDYSVYNAITYRNLSVKRPNQNISGTVSEAVGEGTPGIRVSDIHGNDYGLTSHMARHAGRFGRDSLLVLDPGVSYDELPAMFKVNRNPRHRIITDASGNPIADVAYDNFSVQHQIPRSDRQYAWITSSLTDVALDINNIRYWGFAPLSGPQAGLYHTGSEYLSYFDFVSASSVLGNSGTASIYQPALDLAIYLNDPVDQESDNNLGQALDIGNTTYLNDTLLDVYGITSDLNRREDVFNLLMTKRKNVFGYRGVPLNGPAAPAIIRKHRANNIFTYVESGDTINRAEVKPVSLRGRPTTLNLDVSSSTGITNGTLRATYNNEYIYFSNTTLNDLLINDADKRTVYDNILILANGSPNYTLNWVSYSENVFPSAINEFSSRTSGRTGYDNLYWRDSSADRIELHGFSQNSYGLYTSGSSWVLDAPSDFLTRTGVPTIDQNNENLFRLSNSAGELQNTYTHASPATSTYATGNILKLKNITMGGLYSRKHMLGGSRTVVSPSGMYIEEAGYTTTSPFFEDKIDLYAGEAMWEAPTQAGIVQTSGSSYTFVSYPSEPWFNSYDDYIEDIKLVNRGFAIVPEFRISEHVEEYEKSGINSTSITDTFEIVGTTDNSSNSNFYTDFSNSEFMENFAKVSEDTGLSASELKLTCEATIRLNPYDGFYPAQRTLDLVEQFKNSYGDSVAAQAGSGAVVGSDKGGARPIIQPLFAPGILYNTIKSGIAVDYPVVTEGSKFKKDFYGGLTSSSAGVAWMLSSVNSGTFGYQGGEEFWDTRLPFEAIVNPNEVIGNITLFDMEPHPSGTANLVGLTSSFTPSNNDEIYDKMASNFFGEIGNFFLKDNTYTKISSDVVTSDLRFETGSVYGARIKLRRSLSGSRTYEYESGSTGNNVPYGLYGAKYYNSSTNAFEDATFPLPQDPRQKPQEELQESFTMYSRPTAFGPAVAGRPSGSLADDSQVKITYPADSVSGFNWAFTPPYYNGEAWLDIIFEPTAGESYDLEKILSEVKTKYWRVDAGPSASAAPASSATGYTNTQFIPTFSGNVGSDGDLIYDGKNVNDNAMQINSSINLFGVERVYRERSDGFGNVISNENETVGSRWVIQPKMETPMLNFNNTGIHPITSSNGTLTLPTYASGAVPRGMWHQFGVIEPDASKGIFLEIGRIPTDWLKYHYDVRDNDSIYNKSNASTYGRNAYRTIKPLTDVISFNTKTQKLGQLKESMTIKEAIVAVPYTRSTVRRAESGTNISKTFFKVDQDQVDAALSEANGSSVGDSLGFCGESIRNMVSKVQEYILPPQFDFLHNDSIDPMVMYFFEFEYTFDKDDLSYIWQNLAPRDYKKITKQTSSTAHVFGDNELLNKEQILDDNLRWMVFKVKQRSQKQHSDLTVSQVGQSTSAFGRTSSAFGKATQALGTDTEGYKVEFNWPYDYVSFVETIKVAAEVLYKEED